MSVLKFAKREIKALGSPIEVKNFGFNMLSGKKSKIIDFDTGIAPLLKRSLKVDPEAFSGCTSENVDEHIDILCAKADVICDLGSVTDVDNIVIRSFFGSSVNYTIGEFMLYAADTENELFNEENMLAHECGINDWHKGERNNADWVYDIVGAFRYLGIRILKANGTDDVIRLGHVGVYSNTYTEGRKYISEFFPNNLLEAKEPLCVTDGSIYNRDFAYEISGEHTFNFELEEPKKSLKLWTVVYGEISANAGEGFIEESIFDINYGRKAYVFTAADDKAIDKLALTFKGIGFVEQIGAYAGNTSVNVDFADVIIDDFIGVGADVIPTALMPESLESGYNEVYWELEKCRIEKVKPHVVRVWFQLDWLVSEYEKYKNCDLDFESEKMHAFYKYLDIFKAVGTEVELNFGWKIAEPAQSWFSFENVMNRNASAPKELEPFAEACGKLMYELIKSRGYSNIKYLTFFNESNVAESDSQFWRYDFAVPDEIIAREYYSDMLKLSKQSLLKYGLDDLEIWGFELTEKFDVWAECAKERCGDIVDRFTFHRYLVESSDDEESLQTTAGLFKSAAYYTDKPVIMTECGQVYYPETYSFNMNHIQLFCDATNSGVAGIFIWCLGSVHLTQPSNFMMRNGIDMWDALQCRGGIENVRGSYYELAMLSRYIPNHCKALKTVVEENKSGYRACAFKTDDGNITVVLEADKGFSGRCVNINFEQSINRKLYKHIYKRPCLRNGNAIIPPVAETLFAKSNINDVIDGDYQCVVYTTLEPIPQIAVCNNEIKLLPGEKNRLSAMIIDGEGGIDWKISKASDDSFKLHSAEGCALLETKPNAKSGSMAAIEVTSCKHPEIKNVIIAKIS